MAKTLRRLQRFGLLLLRATCDTARWVRAHVWADLLLVLVSAIAGWLLGVRWESVVLGLLTSFAALGLLFFLMLIYYLFQAPSVLRNRELDSRRGEQFLGMPPGMTPVLTLDIAVTLKAPETSLRYEALQLAQQVRKLREVTRSGGGTEAVTREHRRVLDDIERFGASAADADLEQETKRGRLCALTLYEQVRGFPIHADLAWIEDLIRTYAIPPDSRLMRLRLVVREWIKKLWGRVS